MTAEQRAKQAFGRPREAWLALDNENHEQVGAAMVVCEDPSGSCFMTGVCSQDGDCFLSGGEAERTAAKKIEKLARDENGLVAEVLREAAIKLRREADEARKRR